MTAQPLPEETVDPSLKQGIDAVARSFVSVEAAEVTALAGDIAAPLSGNQHWSAFCGLVSATIHRRGYVVVRGLEADEGRSLLIVSTALGAAFSEYQSRRIVKRFRMSPWTTELSHTMRAGDFHTDGNVSIIPPVGTAMQCEREDPGGPEYAGQRVAYLPELLKRLASGTSEDTRALAFLTEAEAAMAHERSPEVWRGRLVQNDMIRYHPHSLRVARKRLNKESRELESLIAAIHRAAMAVSVPFHTRAGDILLVSNRTALHYRGACSVRFTRFPTEFDSRSLLVLHLKEHAA
ncbi:MAG TPA: TauD/TfdA family dioxygenase [Thermoanaerobaculia bacterium]|nr:TauD/TfdA family dioxygenase [Thermoanaerobaculia bacterium]